MAYNRSSTWAQVKQQQRLIVAGNDDYDVVDTISVYIVFISIRNK